MGIAYCVCACLWFLVSIVLIAELVELFMHYYLFDDARGYFTHV